MQGMLHDMSKSPSGKRQKNGFIFVTSYICKITVALINPYFSSLFGNNFAVVTDVKACLIACRVAFAG